MRPFGFADMRYTLRQLEVFLSVARHESVSQACAELAMSQSAVSGALADLENQFDIALFDRVGRRLQLSALGAALRPRAEALHAQALELERAFEQQSTLGSLRIGATLTIGNYVVAPLMAQFLRDNPGAQVHLDVANTAEIARKVANFEIDVGMIEGELSHPQLDVRACGSDELTVFCAPTHALARKHSLDDDDLRSTDWIVREPGSGTRQTFERAMHGILSELKLRLELQHTEAIKSAVAAGLGMGCVSYIAVAEEVKRGQLTACRVPGRDFRRQYYSVVHRQKNPGPSLERWLELCRANPAAISSSGRSLT
jgi:DNA-binding transcriptional LysR family regulator